MVIIEYGIPNVILFIDAASAPAVVVVVVAAVIIVITVSSVYDVGIIAKPV